MYSRKRARLLRRRSCRRKQFRCRLEYSIRTRLHLDKPDWLFLDEATSALDEKLEEEIYGVLHKVLPETTIVSIGHRATLSALHRRLVEMEPGPNGIFEPTPKLLSTPQTPAEEAGSLAPLYNSRK